MTPTIFGRWQTRFALLATVGVAWAFMFTPLLPRGEAPLGMAYRMSLLALLITAVFGALVWDPIYHFLQQFRWEKDWPSLFALLNGINEGATTWLILHRFGSVPGVSFVSLFGTTWLFIWLTIIGPIRVVLLRRRFIGGRILGA
jgi:hypothetical protein